MTRALAVAAAVLTLTPQTFHSGTEGVRVDVLVTDGRRPVAGLSAADFELRDNGVPQHIESASKGDVPLSLTLALDTSGSVEGERLTHLQDAVRRVAAVLDRDDRAALLTFSERIAEPAPFADGAAGLTEEAQRLEAGGATSVYDAAFTAMMLRDTRPGRRLVLLLTDGRDTSSWLPADTVVDAAHRSDAVVYVVKVAVAESATPNGPWVDVSARLPLKSANAPGSRQNFLADLAEATGGRVFDASSASSGERLVDALREFKSRYLLTYTPTGVDQGGWHTVDVRVKRRGLKVTARRGYQK